MESQFVSLFRATLEPDASVIREAESHIRELHDRPEAGAALLRIVFAGLDELPIVLRQAAAINLGKWIKERWSPIFTEYVGFATPTGPSVIALDVESKKAIRAALLDALSLQESKLRGPLLKALINVASCDWPDEFTDLLPRVKAALQVQHGDTNSIEGALSFLDEWFYTSMDETSLLSIARELFPDLEIILSSPSSSAQVRCHCVSILNLTLETLWMVREEYPEAAKTVAQELLPRWLSILEILLEPEPAAIIASFDRSSFTLQAGEQLALQAQAWQTLGTATHFASHFKPRLVKLQTRAFAALTALQDPFERFHLSQDQGPELDSADGNTFFATPSALAAKVIDFLSMVLYRSRTGVDPQVIETFVPLLSTYSRINASEEEEWLDNVSSFVTASEDDEIGGTLTASMRGRCADVLSELASRLPDYTLVVLSKTASETHELAQRLIAQKHSGWWKAEEASLTLIGGVADLISEENGKAEASGKDPPLNLSTLFSSSVLPHMSDSTPHFLYGRCFVFASQFASSLPAEMAAQFLHAAVQVIESDVDEGEAGLIVKVSAVRCIRNFHRHLHASVVQQYADRILSRLAPLLSNASDDVLVLIIETLQAVAAQRSGQQNPIRAPLYGEMASAAIQAWSREARDRVLQVAVEDLLDAFSRQESLDSAASAIEGALSTVSGLLQMDLANESNGGVIREVCIDFVAAMMKGASKEVLQRTQSSVIHQLFPAMFAILASGSDDREVFNAAARLLSVIINKIPDASLSWSDAGGVVAIQHILNLVSQMISPDDSTESGGLAVGDLLTTLLRKRPEAIAEQLPPLCQALLTRLESAKSTSLVQSLIVPLAFLMKEHLSTVVRLALDHRIGQSGDQDPTALQVLLRKWLEFASSMQGFWNARVSTLGLCAVFEARATLPGLADQIDNIFVDGDLLPDDSNMIKTRSRAKRIPDKYTQVPVPAKIVKIVTAELRQATDGPPKRSSKVSDEDDDALTDDEDDDWGDDEFQVDSASKAKSAFLSDMLGEGLEGELDDLLHEHDEDQFEDDEIWNMQFRSALLQFFRRIAKDQRLTSALAPYLTSDEVKVLTAAVN